VPSGSSGRGPILGLGGRREREPERGREPDRDRGRERGRDDIFAPVDDDLDLGSDDDDFDVPSFLK
jgi:hypothetical protein